MADFLTNLWESIFTPGPTPTLLLATNATFACLQALLLALLLMTSSVHFIALSILCAGLWWGVNWFARELAEAQKKEEEAKRLRGVKRREREEAEGRGNGGSGVAFATVGSGPGASGSSEVVGTEGGEGEGMDSGDDTETEIEQSGHLPPPPPPPTTTFRAGTVTTGLAPKGDEALKKRRSIGESEGLSTDSEWEKVSGSER